MKLRLMQSLANRSTHDRRRAEAMGWVFEEITVRQTDLYRGVELRGYFRCVCGRQEAFGQILDPELPDFMLEMELDFARQLRLRGSFSRHHLLEDGYTEAQIAEFERKGAEFDRRGSAQ